MIKRVYKMQTALYKDIPLLMFSQLTQNIFLCFFNQYGFIYHGKMLL